MPPIMFELNQTYTSVAGVISRFSRWLPWWQSWISERNHFRNSKSPCCPDAFHQVSHLGYLNGTILAILNLCVTVMLPIKFWLNPTFGLGDVVRRISRWPSERNNLSNSESLCRSYSSHKVSAQSDLWFWRRYHWSGGHLGYRNGTILISLISVSL